MRIATQQLLLLPGSWCDIFFMFFSNTILLLYLRTPPVVFFVKNKNSNKAKLWKSVVELKIYNRSSYEESILIKFIELNINCTAYYPVVSLHIFHHFFKFGKRWSIFWIFFPTLHHNLVSKKRVEMIISKERTRIFTK